MPLTRYCFTVTFASGYIAGVICAIVSHPADSMVSLLGKADNKGKSKFFS